MELRVVAGLYKFWMELRSANVDPQTRTMRLPALPNVAQFLPELQQLYVRECYVRLTDIATDGERHFLSYEVSVKT